MTVDPDREAAERFFAAYERKYPLEAVRTPETAPEMVVEEVADSPGWIRWRYYPWSAERDIFQAIELASGLVFPGVFKAFLTTYHTLSVDLGFLRIPETPLGYEGESLRQVVFSHRRSREILQAGLLPFAWDGRGDYGLLCFDRREVWTGDAAVLCVRTFDGSLAREFVAGGFGPLRDACTFALESPVDFLRIGEVTVDSDEVCDAAFDAFLSHDLDGMSTKGRGYWEGLARRNR